MQIRELMSKSVVSITPEESAALAARLLTRHNLGMLPVCGQDGRLVGVVTDRDIVTRCLAAGQDPSRVPVEDIMTRELETLSPQDEVEAASARMADGQVRRLPVVEDGRVVGVLSLADLARSRRYEVEAAQALCQISESLVRRRRR
ncbi:MAG: CBS domain-containing protein [Candidatus Onthomonas sp.]